MSRSEVSERRNAVIVGASMGLGRAISKRLAAEGWDLVIGARGEGQLTTLAAELRDTHDVAVAAITVDIADDASLQAFLTEADAAAPQVDAVIVTAGAVAATDEGIAEWDVTSGLIAANMTGVMKLAGRYVADFETRDRGTLVLFSSIAAGAPRRKNVAYAAAKAGLESFAKSMQHRLGRCGAGVQLYRLGYVDTRLAEGQDLLLKPADPAKVAARVVDGLGQGSRTVFEPRYWGAIVRGLRVLPAPIYNRLDF